MQYHIFSIDSISRSVIAADSHSTSEINLRIGLANSEFAFLQKKKKNVSCESFCSKKKYVFHALVIPKLMYALDGIWLNQCQRRRFDSFYVGCIRRIVIIQHAYYSNISNEDVLKAAHSTPLSLLLLRNQLKSFSRITSLDNHNCVREMIFEPDDSFTLKSSSFQRKQGRPRLT